MNYLETLPKVQELINSLLIVLSEKEKFIIENRFSLNENPRLTLESIGKKYSVTRERIRQIEKNALKKLERNVNNTSLNQVTALALEIIQERGGVVEEEEMIMEILRRSPDPETIDVNSLKLTVDLEKDIIHVHNTIQFKPYWKLKNKSNENVRKVCEASYRELIESKKVIDSDKLSDNVLKKLKITEPNSFAISCLDLDRRIKVLPNNKTGLTSWRSINPKTLRDKIYYVLKNATKPLHYIEIANMIASLKLDTKSINTQAVHNELIRHNGFVLIGRGIYALQEWGYNEGTVCDVITEILKEKGEMKRDEIIAEVLKRRQVKKITIQLNLKNKPEFERIGRDVYKLAE